jgi:hypothetical protein
LLGRGTIDAPESIDLIIGLMIEGDFYFMGKQKRPGEKVSIEVIVGTDHTGKKDFRVRGQSLIQVAEKGGAIKKITSFGLGENVCPMALQRQEKTELWGHQHEDRSRREKYRHGQHRPS